MPSTDGRAVPDLIQPEGGGRPRALAVVTFFPWPLNHGDALRRLMFLEALASETELTVVCLERSDTTPEDVAGLRERLPGVAIEVLPAWHRGTNRTRGRLGRLLRGLVTASPPLLYQQWHPELVSRVADISAGTKFSLAVLVGGAAGVCAGQVKADQVVLDMSNIMTASELDALVTLSSPVARLRALVTLPLNYALEKRVLRRVDQVVVTSEEESRRLRRFFGPRSTSTIKSATYPLEPAPGVDYSSKTLLWLSTFNYPPNWDGLLRSLRTNGPALEAGGYTLRVVGAGATDRQVERLRSFSCVDYQGYAEKLSDACDGVGAAVVPVWAGAGVKLKTLTFLGLGVPVLATPVALEGIPHEAAAWVAHRPSEFMEALQSLTPHGLREAAVRGREVLEAHFSQEAFAGSVTQLVREAVRSGSA